ncbi:Dystrophin-like protein 1 [Dirofilaria immitis]|nr:Dystrophin-like protein 1 [Dirofilaria immitis]
MSRFSDTDKDDKALSEEQRFYYLRLMAKPSSGKNEPIKTKFVRWSSPYFQQESLESNHDLESQAMRVVRTIGQAFEVCHKVAQEQMQEKYQEDSESSCNVKLKKSGSFKKQKDWNDHHSKHSPRKLNIISTENESDDDGIDARDVKLQQMIPGSRKKRYKFFSISDKIDNVADSLTSTEGDHVEVEEKLAKVSEASHSPSPTDEPPPLATTTTPAYLQKHHSIFVPQKPSDAVLNSSTAVEAPAVTTANTIRDYEQSSTSIEAQNCHPLRDPLPFVSGSSTLPHSITWGPQMTAGQFQSMQTLDQRGLPTMPYYPMPIMGPSTSMPYGLSSPYLLSPYATLPLPGNTSEQQSSTTNPNIPGSPLEGQDLTTYQLSLSLDQYNQHLIRSQLDQAQQTAQVASCQVQLLRDQLTSETTARIEAQSRTHQLLNANRELLEQVQALVLRLQSLETRLAEEIQERITQPSTSKMKPESATLLMRAPGSKPISQLTSSLQEQFKSEAKVPGPPPVDPSKPYQLQSLADIRAGSLPPQGIQSKTTSTAKNLRMSDDFEARTEPESGAEDTTDYSSSDQYEKVPFSLMSQQRLLSQNPLPGPHLNILMSNPQPTPSDNYVPSYLNYPTRSQNSEASKDDEEQQNPLSTSRRARERSGVLRSGTLFKRMSFNPKLWETKRKDVEAGGGGVIVENIDESQTMTKRAMKNKKVCRKMKMSTLKEKSDRLQATVSVEPGTSEVLSDIGEMEVQNKINSSRRKSLFSSETVQLEPASLHLATAMYPPRRMEAKIATKIPLHNKLPQNVREEVPTSSSFVQQQQSTALIGNGPVSLSLPGRPLSNHIGTLDEKEKLRKTNNSGPRQILILQEALKHSLASTKQQLMQTNETLDGMRGSLRYMESEKQKLGDPMVLAKLTKLPTFMSTIDSSDEKQESPSLSGTSLKSANDSSIILEQDLEARKGDAGVS